MIKVIIKYFKNEKLNFLVIMKENLKIIKVIDILIIIY